MSLEVENIRKRVGDGDLLADISFSVNQGEFVGILGPSGCGKSTLLRILAGLDSNFVGRVCLDGVASLAPSRQCAVVFQDARLLPWLRAWQNVAFAMDPSDKGDKIVEATQLLRLLGLSDSFANHWPHELSGGMQRRVALARALAGHPKALLLDEPLSGIDVASAAAIKRLLVELRQNRSGSISLQDTATVLVTHDISEAVTLCTRILVLERAQDTRIKEIRRITLPFPRDSSSNEFRFECEETLRCVLSLAST